MVDMLASNDWCDGVALLCANLGTSRLELLTLLFETSLDSLVVTMMVLAVLHRDDVMSVLLGQHLAVLDRLYRGVVVILVHLTVDGSLSLLMTVLANLFVHNSGSDLLVNGRVMMTRLGPARIEVSIG